MPRALTPVVVLSSLLLLSAAAGRSQAAEPDLRLVTAVAEQNEPAVLALLAARVDVNAARPDGATALLWAAHWNDLGLVERLVRAGAKVSTANDRGMTPLALACENASAPMVKALLSHGADPNRAQENGVTPLMTAARTGSVEVMKALFARGARVNAVIPSTGQTALMWATSERHLDAMRELIAAGADVRSQATLGFTSLLFAARNGDVEAAKLLIAAGAGVDDRGADGTQALPLAIVSGQDAFARFLLEQGADANGTMAGVGALHAAAGNVDYWLRDWLRARRMSVHARNTAGLDPVRRVDMVKALLAHGANPNARVATATVMGLGVSGRWGAFDVYSVGTGDLKGATPLWVAAYVANGASSEATRSSALTVLRDLLDAGADPSLRTDDGTTPLMVAAGLGRQSYQPGVMRGTRSPGAEGAVKMLVEAGADLNAVNEGSFTAIHGAAFRGLNEVVQYLAASGADINAQDFQGRTAYRIAKGTQQGFRVQAWPETAKFIEDLGADTAIAPWIGADGQISPKVGSEAGEAGRGGTAGARGSTRQARGRRQRGGGHTMKRSVLKSVIPLTAATLAVVAIVELVGLHASQAAAPAAQPAADRAPVDRALLDKYCVTCHNERLKTAGLTLDKIDLTKIGEHAATLEKVVQKLRSGQMPPDGRPRPEKPDVDRFVTSLETALDRATEPNPGRVATHRLNRLEYVNVIRDLLDLEIDPDLLPADNPGLGFDNNADILSVTPALVNRYMSAASKISRLALGDPTQRAANSIYRVAEFAAQDARMSEDLPFGTHGGLAVRHTFPLDGMYAFKVRMQRNTIGDTIRGLDDEHEVELRIDRKLVKRFRVGGQYKGYDPGFVNSAPDDDLEGQRLHTYRLNADEPLQLQLPVKAGPHLITAAFTDSAPGVSELVPLVPSSLKRSTFTDDSGEPGIESVSIAGPQEATSAQDTPSRRRIFVCQPTGTRDADSCARTILSTLARRAYRRPLNDADLQELMRLYTTGSKEGGFEAGVGLALETLLWSPAFLIRMEHDRAGAVAGAVQRVSDLELASRLSFFLWKSAPDDTLLALAAKGRLSDPAVRAQQVARMMADPKSNRWIDDFTDQWLTVRNIQTQEPDPDLNPDFDDTLREAMAKETELFVASQVRDDKSLLDLLNADYTFLNARLARHYKIPNVYGSHFRRVAVTDPARRGLLGQASILTVTSYANRTSVVLRGKWVLESLLGAPPPPPPANVPPLPENKPGAAPTSLRERMEQHRKNPVCASCHTHMDPLGFVLENFDATGRWRDTESGLPINAVGNASGVTIDGPAGVRDYLVGRGDEVVRTVTRKLLEYALGRSLEHTDAPTLRQLVRDVEQKDNRWSALILGIVESAPFQMRSAAGAADAAPVASAR